MRFREFFENTETAEEADDIKRLLEKIPKAHAALVKGYRWKFQAGNTLHGDSEHVGFIDNKTKEIVVAGPWNYGREFTVLHEIGHKVYDLLDRNTKLTWDKIVKNTKMKPGDRQPPQELFCHAYAATYTKRPPVSYCHPNWIRFIRTISQQSN